ncbi:O-antigen ligase family protein [Capnocytophaga sp. ARDL2]|uniref:O-antigen ligase family protein n=1 Tax=Capnocytophaga sp. ARDL2 TaxID=3238809 RepID=UPI0035578B05
MMISREKFNIVNHFFVVIIAALMVFREISTPILVLFFLWNAFHFKYLDFKSIEKKHFLWIASPFLIHVLFLWNDDLLSASLQQLEKNIAFFLLPLFILSNKKSYDFYKIAWQHSLLLVGILWIFLFRFIIAFPEKIEKYINGIDLIEVGYEFAKSMNTHAPALNKHIVFVSVIGFYFMLKYLFEKKYNRLISSSFIAFSGFVFVLIVNTRIALFCVILLYLVVAISHLNKRFSTPKVVLYSGGVLLVSSLMIYAFVQINPYMKEKYSTVTFHHIDKIGRLDEIPNPEIQVFNSFVTRLSIYKSTYELAVRELPFGTGAADAQPALNDYYKETNQKFLAQWEFPVHNQFLNYLLKFGVLGAVVFLFISVYPIAVGWISKNILATSFGLLFFISNLTDDFLIRYDGIVFCALFCSLFAVGRLQYRIK